MQTFAVRLLPGQDLKESLKQLVVEKNIRAGVVLTCVGSLQKAVLRMADENIINTYEERFEIVSLVGTLSADGVHLHAALSRANGEVIGGHVSDGCTIYTTAEIVVADVPDVIFKRVHDEQTGFKELVVESTM